MFAPLSQFSLFSIILVLQSPVHMSDAMLIKTVNEAFMLMLMMLLLSRGQGQDEAGGAAV